MNPYPNCSILSSPSAEICAHTVSEYPPHSKRPSAKHQIIFAAQKTAGNPQPLQQGAADQP
ncbi:hypothetical protein [Neisseria animalis]|uniref:hypothetical protein n=1 Tax=Neisseria animalis TaxID=492 RepID=UPI000F50F2D1|nr:hypothetical protein [Neisseria animalis]ROW32795.1 hypothetical protein CGZ60_02940 [Neisseria animalis]